MEKSYGIFALQVLTLIAMILSNNMTVAAGGGAGAAYGAQHPHVPAGHKRSIRFATFNASLNRNEANQLIDALATDTPQIAAVAEIIQRVDPDVLLINEFDFDEAGEAVRLFRENYLSVSQNGAPPIEFEYAFSAPSNTGIPSGFDFDNNGSIGGPNDAFGFGSFPGQFGMVVYSKYPIAEAHVRTFQQFLWKDMPGALLPDDAATPEPNDWYSEEELAVFRLSSKSHWDVPIDIDGTLVHVLASHPTPPVFDGAEDRNGTRNHDEIRFWADYIRPNRSAYIADDAGRRGGLKSSAKFVIMGDLNADPRDGDSTNDAVLQVLRHGKINTRKTPASDGAVEASISQAGANSTHDGDPAFDTADFLDVPGPGNLRADYVLPARHLPIAGSGVFWPTTDDPLFASVGVFPFPSSDHRLVWVDLMVESHR